MKVTLTMAVKRQITRDWASCFPELGIYEPMHLLRRVGPLLIGIALERDSGNDSYRPIFHVHNLARARGHITLTLAQPLRTVHKGAPETLPARWHESKFRDAASRLAQQSPLPLLGDVTLKQVLNVYQTRAAKEEYDRFLFEDMALICSWAGQKTEAERVVISARSTMESWPEYVQRKIGNLNNWESGLLSLVSDPKSVQVVTQSEIKALHVQDLPQGQLLI